MKAWFPPLLVIACLALTPGCAYFKPPPTEQPAVASHSNEPAPEYDSVIVVLGELLRLGLILGAQ